MPKKSPLGVLAKVDADFVAEKLAVEVPLKLNTKRLSRFPMEFQRKKKWKHRPQSSGTVGACVGASALPAPDRAHRAAGLEVHLVLDNYATHLGMVFGRLTPRTVSRCMTAWM